MPRRPLLPRLALAAAALLLAVGLPELGLRREVARQRELRARGLPGTPAWVRQLMLAADPFLVRRGAQGAGNGRGQGGGA